jgi:NADH dehydrogenase/NADH:ubiquinone oxidoreductase subunit G
VVDYVVPDSPAAAAGIQQNDILKMLNDQILTEPDQLSKLVRSYSEGTNITLTVLRKGQEQKLPVKLTKKEVPQRRWFGRHEHDLEMGDQDFGALGETLRDQLSNLKEQLRDSKQGLIHDAVMKAHEEVARAREEALRAGQRARDEAQRVRDEAQRERDRAQRERDEGRRAGGELKITHADESGLKTTKIDLGKAQIFSDDKGELRIDCAEGKRILTAKDPKGMLLFSGPVATSEDIEKIPAEVRDRFEKLQQKDLPAVVGPDENDADDDADDADYDEDEDAGSSVEQVSMQTFPRNMWTYRIILL